MVIPVTSQGSVQANGAVDEQESFDGLKKVVARILFLLLLMVIPCSVEAGVTKKPAGNGDLELANVTTPGVFDPPGTPNKFAQYAIAALCGALCIILLSFFIYCCYQYLKPSEGGQQEMEEKDEENREVDDVEAPVLAPEERDEKPQTRRLEETDHVL